MNSIRIKIAVLSIRATKLLFVILSVALLPACSKPESNLSKEDWQSIDPIFRTMYDYLGGKDTLGPAISQLIDENGTKIQYTRAVKLVYNKKETPQKMFRLAPIGVELGFVQPSLSSITQEDDSLCKGHHVAPIFLEIYEKLGREFVGCPITELRFNPQRIRYEQYFENIGFYQLKGTDSVHTLDWGWIACGDICLYSPITQGFSSGIADPGFMDVHYRVHPVFREFASRLRTDLTGFALSEAFIGRDGRIEQIFEGLVLAANSAESPESVVFRPLSQEFHLPVAAPLAWRQIPGYKFYRTQNELGYEIPDEIWEFIQSHGGIVVTGAPITHLNAEANYLYSQCFENLCLYYDLTGTGMPRVYPMPLGYVYKSFNTPPESSSSVPLVQPTETKEKLTLDVWESMASVRSDQQQEIGIIALENTQPAPGIEPILIIYMPDGSHFNISLTPTGADGKTGVRLPVLSAPSGSIINYEICVEMVSNKLFCVGRSFLIWDNP